MKPIQSTFRMLATSLGLATVPYIASAYPIEVPNSSFEVDRADKIGGLTDGEDIYMLPDVQDWYQYNVYTNGGPQRYWNPAAVPTAIARFTDSGFGGIAPDGDHVGITMTRYNDDRHPDGTNLNGSQGPEYPASYVRDFEALAQVLEDVLFDPSEPYTLTVEVGHPPGKDGDPDKGFENYDYNGYAVQLLAGGYEFGTGNYAPTVYDGTLIAEDYNTVAITANTFQTITVTYTPGDLTAQQELDLAGLPLQIRLCALEDPSDHSTLSIVAFDDVRLDGPPPAPMASIAAPGTGETDYTLQWTSYEGREYNILSSTDLVNWSPVVSGLTTSPPTNTYSLSPAGPLRFYSVEQVPAQ